MKRSANLWLVLLLGVVAAGCTGEIVGGTAGCTDGSSCPSGGACVQERCQACDSDSQCRDAFYGDGARCAGGACQACPAGSEGCGCTTSGTCDTGLVCDPGAGCRLPLTCAQAGCGSQQLCQATDGTLDSFCLDSCLPGYSWDAGTQTCVAGAGNCDPGGAEGSILADCQEEHRECVASGTTASCGDCVAGYGDPTGSGTCVLVTCADLQATCTAGHRFCQPSPTRCGPCLDSYIEEGGACRPVLTCPDLGETCNSLNQVCMNETEASDAYCAASGGNCDCSGPGNTGEKLTAANGACICQTLNGYFTNVSSLFTEPCDADGDGWVRVAVRDALQQADAVIRQQIKCTINVMTSLVLSNDPGLKEAPTISDPVGPPRQPQQSAVASTTLTSDNSAPYFEAGQVRIGLYETKNIDDDGNMALEGGALPAYGNYRFRAGQLNSFTKACVEGGNFNLDGIPDVATGQPTSGSTAPNPVFTTYSYFVELYTGWFEGGLPTPIAGTGAAVRLGTYTIREKSRRVAAYDDDLAAGRTIGAVPVRYAGGEPGDYWRECLRMEHPKAAPGAYVAFDFQRDVPTGGGFAGMYHHSQFRCGILGTDAVADDQAGKFQASQINSTMALAPLQMNICGLVPSADLLGASEPAVLADLTQTNSPPPQIACTALTPASTAELQALTSNSTVGWFAVRYSHTEQPASYEGLGRGDASRPTAYKGGCINECALQPVLPDHHSRDGYDGAGDRCDGWTGQSPGFACTHAMDNFGAVTCGCGKNFGGLSCEVNCSPRDRHAENDNPIGLERTALGYWMCAGFAATDDVVLSDGVASGYRLRGSVPSEPSAVLPYNVTGTAGCADTDPSTPCFRHYLSDGQPNGYRLTPSPYFAPECSGDGCGGVHP